MTVVRFFDEGGIACLFESEIIDVKWQRATNKTGEWTFQLPLESYIYDLLYEGLRAELWHEGVYCIGGKIQEINIAYDLDPLIEVKGREEIDELYDFEADPVFYPHAQNFLLQLFTLLDRGGWRFGLYKDIDPDKLITVDLRQKRQLLPQIASLLQQDPFLKYRYGGTDYDGQPVLDVSLFTDPYVHEVRNASPNEQSNAVVIETAKSKDSFINRIYAGRAIGGLYNTLRVGESAPRETTLESGGAIDANPALIFDPEFPIYEEIVSTSYIVIPVSEGGIGGRQYCIHQAASESPSIGGTSATLNTWSQFVCKPPPGLLTEVSFWPETVVNEATLKATNQLAWEICEVNEVTPHIPGTLLSSGLIDNSNWTALARCRVTFDDPVTVTYDKRYMFRVGFVTAPATGNFIRLKILASSNNARTMRYDRSTQRSSGYTNMNAQPTFEAITTATVIPKGRRASLENPRMVPQQAGESYSVEAEIEEAAIALYEWFVEQIRASSVPLRELPLTLSGFDVSWRPGDNVLVVTELQFPDGVRQETEIRTVESIDFSIANHAPSMSVKFMPNTPIELPEDKDIAIWDEAQKRLEINRGLYVANPKEWELTEITVPIANLTPDTTLLDGTPAITVSFTVPPEPIGKYETRILGTPYLIHDIATIPLVVELVSKPPNALIIKAAIKDVGWRLEDTATAYAHIVWR